MTKSYQDTLDDYLWDSRYGYGSLPSVSNVKPKTVKKVKQTTTLNVYEDQEYINTLTGPTKIAVIAISELVRQGTADLMFLRDEELKEFWEKHLKKIKAIKDAKAKEENDKRVLANALAKLTPEEIQLIKVCGIVN